MISLANFAGVRVKTSVLRRDVLRLPLPAIPSASVKEENELY